MFNIRVVQANYGDAIILEYGSAEARRFALIDGGPRNVWRNDLKEEVVSVANAGGRFDFVAISHVDSDHITGILDFFADLEEADANGEDRLLQVDALWLNAFTKTIGGGDESIQMRFSNLMDSVATPQDMMQSTEAFLGIQHGNKLRVKANQLSIPINPGFPDDLIIAETAPEVQIENMSLRIVGPTQFNLDELRTEWLEWLEKNEAELGTADASILSNSDTSLPNLSSLMFLVEAENKTALFTGDGRSDHLLQGLDLAGLLDGDGRMHVNVLKVMHHGSDRNVTKSFFRKVTADTYVISANGHPDNPDLATLIWIVEAAKEQNRQIHIICTNERPTTRKLVQEYDPTDYGYTLEVMPRHWRYRLIELAT